MKRYLALALLCFPTPTFASTGDMFGDQGYVPANFWTPPAHDHADMFGHNEGYVGSNAEMFRHVQIAGDPGVSDLFTAHDMGQVPDMAIFHRPDRTDRQ